uniref:transmembrane protein 95 isoform X5 n=1 Tax=Halichoerus grypus TaxID=9711 RepID=UPI001659D7B7|nr:transmembrane protein 95 isoform X5 [Halichoerus grypus]
MWMLALGGVFLATAQACVLCHLSARDLSGRLAQLCSRVEVLWKDCGASWSFPAFALEIKGSLSSLPLYWRWLQNTRLPAYTREALCAPACRGSTILYNCSTCQEFKVRCWPRKRCLPGSTPRLGLPLLRKSRSSGSQDSAPLCLGSCPAAGCYKPRGGVSLGGGRGWASPLKPSTAVPPPSPHCPALPRPPFLCLPAQVQLHGSRKNK